MPLFSGTRRHDARPRVKTDYRRAIAEAVDDFCRIAATEEAQTKLRAFADKNRQSSSL